MRYNRLIYYFYHMLGKDARHKERMKHTRYVVMQHLQKSHEKKQNYYNIKAKVAKISVGDTVLEQILTFEGNHRLEE